MHLSALIEALLFYKGEPMRVKEIAKSLSVSEEKMREALTELKGALAGRGIRLVETEDAVMLATARDAEEKIALLRKEELERDLGKAGLEVLAIILYYGPVTRARVDYIRGVNSTFSLRQLLVRGLVERVDNPNDQRSFLYKPTLELLRFLGITSLNELPDFETARQAIASFAAREATPDASDLNPTP